jgi:uncharacterized alpha/beta hydrolase family protein
LYLCIVLDLFGQLVVGCSMHHRQDRQMVIRAVQMAVWQLQGNEPVILHSDSNNAVAKFPGRLDSHSDRPVIDLVRWDFRSS